MRSKSAPLINRNRVKEGRKSQRRQWIKKEKKKKESKEEGRKNAERGK